MWIHFLSVVSLATLLLVGRTFSQKPSLNLETRKDWAELNKYGISDDGEYIWYSYFSRQNTATLVLKSLKNRWKRVFQNATTGYFTQDDEYFVFRTDSVLNIYGLYNNEIYSLNGVKDVKLLQSKGRWICYTNAQGLVVYDIKRFEKKFYGEIKDCHFDSEGKRLIVNIGSTLLLVNLETGKEKTIAQNTRDIRHLSFSDDGKRICFLRFNGQDVDAFYYDDEMDTARLLVLNERPDQFKLEISYDDCPRFSPDGRRIFFSLKQPLKKLEQGRTIVTSRINVWSYKDRYLQSYQKNQLYGENERRLMAVFTVDQDRIVQLENSDSSIVSPLGNNYVIVKKVSNESEAYWAPKEFPAANLVRLSDGTRYECANSNSRCLNFLMSPNEDFVISYDTLSKHCYSYEITTGILRNLTGKLTIPQSTYENGRIKHVQYEIEGWVGNTGHVLVYDEYDLWEIDASGKYEPIALTGGYGREKRVAFRLATSLESLSRLKNGDSIVLAALADSSKYNGFLKIKLGKANELNALKLEPYAYYFPGIFIPNTPGPLIKASNANVYVLQRQSDIAASNVVTTNDFQNYSQHSYLSPQSLWNWLTVDLIHWKAYDGAPRSGLLYKPENFDPKIRYPIIFNYYEVRSNERFRFLSPSLSGGDLNIPWYASNGYLVFVPDIHKHTAHTGQAVLNSVLSAVDHLASTYPWIDTTRMGLQGHSFGGYETNYIITQSTRFAAAQSSAGLSDFVSAYGGLGFGMESLAGITEVGQNDMGSTPWDQPLLYVQNSPIFFVNRVTTPLLLMHNSADGVVPMAQSIELFTALRRLGKPVWLLEYDDKGHALDVNEPESLDFTIRQRQFFNYYLKGERAPKWMTRGIPFSLKGVISGLELDSLNEKP